MIDTIRFICSILITLIPQKRTQLKSFFNSLLDFPVNSNEKFETPQSFHIKFVLICCWQIFGSS